VGKQEFSVNFDPPLLDIECDDARGSSDDSVDQDLRLNTYRSSFDNIENAHLGHGLAAESDATEKMQLRGH
jgi:hypothetical protein